MPHINISFFLFVLLPTVFNIYYVYEKQYTQRIEQLYLWIGSQEHILILSSDSCNENYLNFKVEFDLQNWKIQTSADSRYVLQSNKSTRFT